MTTRRRRVRERVLYNAMRRAGDYAERYESGQRMRYAGKRAGRRSARKGAGT